MRATACSERLLGEGVVAVEGRAGLALELWPYRGQLRTGLDEDRFVRRSAPGVKVKRFPAEVVTVKVASWK